MNDAKKLLADMKALGIKEGETILVHASMKALGTKETPETVLDTLQAALGDDGTLLLPALTYENVTPEHPVFDADKTVPCIGAFAAHVLENAGRGAQRAPDALRLCARQACCGADSIAWRGHHPGGEELAVYEAAGDRRTAAVYRRGA